jgi:glutathione synthase/RimK-type ligase-like ATP-grasp enzyme
VSSFDVTLVTYHRIPELTADDQLLAHELRRRGLRVRAAVWSDPDVDWSQSVLTVLRSTWDYFHRPAQFLAWVEQVKVLTRVLNSPDLIRWNHDKHYLDDLHARGIATIPTLFAEPASTVALADAVAMFGTTDVVIKPAIGGAAYGARRYALGRELGDALTHLDQLVSSGCALIQPFISSVLSQRERSLIFFDGAFSHAYLKAPFSGGTLAGEAGEVAHQPSAAEQTLARAALSGLTERPTYARVDMALIDERPHLMELELIEPALHFQLAPGSEERLADALENVLEGAAGASRVERAASAHQPLLS